MKDIWKNKRKKYFMKIHNIRGQIFAGIIAILGLWFIVPEDIFSIKIKLLFTCAIAGATLLKILIIMMVVKKLKQKEEEEKRRRE